MVGRYVADDVHVLILVLGFEQFVYEKLQLITRIDAVVPGPEVDSGTVVGVNDDETEVLTSIQHVASRSSNGLQCLVGQLEL